MSIESLLELYMMLYLSDWGIIIFVKVSNVTKVIQYQPGRALAPFVKKVTSMRIAAKEEKDEPKGTTAKLMGNSGKFIT